MMDSKIVDQYWYVDIADTDTQEFDNYLAAYDFYMDYREKNPDAWITLGCVTDRVVGTFSQKEPPGPNDFDYEDYDLDEL